MRLLDRYIFREWLKVFLMAIGATLGILLLENIYNNLPDLLGWGATPKMIARYYIVLLPGLLPTVMPLSLLVSVLYLLGALHRNHEITAMRAAGLSIFRITRSLWAAGVLLAVGLFYLNADLVPWSVQQSRNLKESIRFASEAERQDRSTVGLVYHLAFENRREGRLWFFNRFSQLTYQGFGVNVYSRDAAGRETFRVMAREAFFDDFDEHWVLLDGREVTFDVATGEPIRSLPFERKAYPEFSETPTTMRTLAKRPKDLSFYELESVLVTLGDDQGQADRQYNAYAVRYQAILASPFICIIVIGIAVPFAVAGVRTNPMVGVSKSAGLFFAYYLVANLCTMMGAQEILNPVMAAWTPNLIMLGLSGYLMSRVA